STKSAARDMSSPPRPEMPACEERRNGATSSSVRKATPAAAKSPFRPPTLVVGSFQALPMKLLFCGSLLVVLGVIASAAIDSAIESVVSPAHRAAAAEPVLRFVNGGREQGASSQKAIVWQTSTALEDCAWVVDRR